MMPRMMSVVGTSPGEGFAGLTRCGVTDSEETEKSEGCAEVELAKLPTVGFEVIW